MSGAGDQRVFLVDGQAVYLEGGGDISEDVLQQALAQLAGRGATATEEQQQAGTVLEVQDDGGTPAGGASGDAVELADAEDGEEGVLAVLQDETGQQQTVRLTPSQAAALGIDYDELLAAAGQVEPSTEEQEESADASATEQQLSTGGVLALDAGKTEEGDSKVTYTFEVVDDPEQADGASAGSDLLAKSRQIMVPQVRPGGTAAPSKSAATAASTVTAARLTVGKAASGSGTATASAGGAKSAAADGANNDSNGAGATAEDPSEDDPDVPVILTPMNGQNLPDFIEPRPGLKILVRPLRETPGAPPPPARPLGSSDNPIQLVQQGNTFKSLQPLSAEQLKQIATVLQQSRLNVPGNAKNTIYDANTNTRIVYRVVYPEDQRPAGRGRSSSYYTPRGRGRGRPRGRGRGRGRARGRPRKEDYDQDWHPGMDTEMEPVDPAEKKKITTKTRTGRVSKPPKHMVKDYKHIHRLDLNQPDLDDSDGGYSDYGDLETGGDGEQEGGVKTEPGEDGEAGTSSKSGQRLTAAGTPRVKREVPQAVRDRFTCRTCGTLCIGYARLEGHYRKNPTHRRHSMDFPSPVKPRPAVVYTGRRGRPPRQPAFESRLPAKRPRLEEPKEPEEEPLSPEQLVTTLLDQSGGSINRLCDAMAECVKQFRERVRGALRSPAEDEEVDESAAFTIDAERSALTGLPEGVYLPTERPASAAASAVSSPAPSAAEQPQSPRPPAAAPATLTLEEALAAQMEEPPEQLMETEPEPEPEPADKEEAGTQEPMEQDAGAAPAPAEGDTKPAGSPAEKSDPAGTAAEGERPPEGRKEPAEPVGDVLDEFVGGLVDTADYAPLPPGGETAPAAAAEFDAGQIQIRLPDGRDLTAAAAPETATEAATEGETEAEAGASMPLLADQR
ncbi:hypothetical protein FJT64_010988 [Amphibalanus amphitrite]|uniref:DUF4764 domain-containing protein n=1 Tax=Amphibalanus amphitrite TaxID=1232801 RepID=A0A6A4VGZ2_AMPAM|nr:hypothetical protein FJT64_010988 [Amphibalanus amphitrite]